MAITGVTGLEGTYQQYGRVQNATGRPLIDGSFYTEKLSKEKKAPYSGLADENGMITYKGVVFLCDDEKQTISLGDMTDEKKILSIPLEEGGCLKVNRDNLGDLSRAISMFSPEDVRRIMSAIAQDTQCTRKQMEIEEMEDTAVKDAADQTEA